MIEVEPEREKPGTRTFQERNQSFERLLDVYNEFRKCIESIWV